MHTASLHPPTKSLGSNCLVPMATRQLVTSKLFQPPGTTPSLSRENHKLQVWKQNEAYWRLSPWSNQRSFDLHVDVICRTERTARSSDKNERLGAISLWNWLEEWFPCRKWAEQQSKNCTFLPASKALPCLQWPPFPRTPELQQAPTLHLSLHHVSTLRLKPECLLPALYPPTKNLPVLPIH